MAITVDYYLVAQLALTYIGSAPFAEIAKRQWRHRQRQARKFGPDLRADRRTAAAEALAATAGLPNDGA